MNTTTKRFAPFGLYLAILAALGAAGLYIVERQFDLPLQILLGLIVIGLAVYAILDPDGVRRSLTGRQARYGSNVLVMILAFVGILVVINYLGYTYTKRWDLTADKTNTLAPETLNTLKALPSPVRADAFFTSSLSTDTAKTLLQNYQYNSNGKFTYQFINPDSNPVAAQQAKITQNGSIVLHMDGRQEIVTSTTEQDLTSGLVRLMNPNQYSVYFLTGHGEQDPNGSGNRAYSLAKQALTSKNYTVKTLNLLTDHQVPADAKVLVIAGPTKPLSQEEIKPIQDFVNKGGGLIVMEEPLPVTQFGNSDDPLADYLSKSWNITLDKDIVIDPGSNQLSIALAAKYGNSPITQKLNTMITIFPTARTITVKPGSTTGTVTTLIQTSSSAWGETDFAALANNQFKYTAGQDVAGPLTIAVTDEDTTKNSHIVVIGDSDFASDSLFNQYGNGDLFVNAVDWAAGQSNLISLTPKSSTTRVVVPPSNITINLIFLGTVIILPGLVLFSGIFTWIQRRRKG